MSSRFPRLQWAAVLIAISLAAACGGGQKAEPEPARPTTNPVNPATAGTVTGHVILQGTPPANQPIKTKTDPNCAAAITTQDFVVGDAGAFANVFVYVKDGLGKLVFPIPADHIVLSQKNCQYVPHVFGIQVGQTLDIISADTTLHNVHGVAEKNQEFNFAQALPGVPTHHVFSTQEVMVPFKCDVHNWMHAFLGVVDHPYFAVTGTDGGFSLKGLPPGTYTVEAVHEKLGRQEQTVTIGEKETKDISFSFKI